MKQSFYTPLHQRGSLLFYRSVCLSVTSFIKNVDYAILWEAFLDPTNSYFLFADLVGFYTH
jgi:hypothetical protein